jgi:hypothetical protein
MSTKYSPGFTVQELQRLARDYHAKLIADFPNVNLALGGNLFLGKHCCQSNRIFLGLNPGGEEANDFKTELLEWNFWDYPNPGCPYWENCKFFVNAAKGLHDWLTPATVAFCSPWRTPYVKKLYALNTETDGKLFQYSGELAKRLVESHKDLAPGSQSTLVVAGRASLHLISSPPFLDFNWLGHQKFHNGAAGTYQ